MRGVQVLVPFRDGKSRLSHPQRHELARAFCADVVAAAKAAELVADVHVVPDGGLGLNGDLTRAASNVVEPILVVLADQPSLTSSAIDAVLTAALAHNKPAMVSDAHGIGTTMLFSPTGVRLEPMFGPRSRAAHRSIGVLEIAADARARRDVADDVDLWDAVRLGVGQHTRAALQR